MIDKKQGSRPHHLGDWMASKGWIAADLARESGVDKSMISKYLDGATPLAPSQRKLAKALGTTPEGLFRHPDESWVVDFLAGRRTDEVKRIKDTLETAFPKKAV